jgi:non-homologous end joining protein Ku
MGSAQHVQGDLCQIPVTITVFDDAVEVRAKTILVDKKTNTSLQDAVTKPDVVEDFQNVVDALKAELAVDAIPASEKIAARDALLALVTI